MMSVYHPSFNFLNKNSYEDYKLIVTHFDADQGESDTWLGMDPIYSDTAQGVRRLDYGAKFNSVATPRITVIKADGTDFTVAEVREFLKWTTGSRKNSYLELCDWNDEKQEWETKFRLLGRTTSAYQQKLDARTVGLIIEFTTVSPFAYSPIIITEEIQIDGETPIPLIHESDDYDTPIYLDIKFTNKADNGTLTVLSGTMAKATEVKNLRVNEKITINSNGFITSDSGRTLGNDFNYVFPNIGYTSDRDIVNTVTVTGNGTIQFEYIYFIKMGDCTIDIDVSGGGMSCNPGSGSSGGGTIVADSVAWDDVTGKPELYTKKEIDEKLAAINVSGVLIDSDELDAMLTEVLV